MIVSGEPEVPVYKLGNTADPLTPFLMNEEANGGQTLEEERFYGYCLSSARMVTENSFGCLKARFGCLRKMMDLDLKYLPYVIHRWYS